MSPCRHPIVDDANAPTLAFSFSGKPDLTDSPSPLDDVPARWVIRKHELEFTIFVIGEKFQYETGKYGRFDEFHEVTVRHWRMKSIFLLMALRRFSFKGFLHVYPERVRDTGKR